MSVWYTFAVSVAVLAIIFGIARLLLPYASEYKSDISTTISEYIGQPVRIGSLDAEWRGFGPALVLKEVTFVNQKTKNTVLQLNRARIGIDLVSSLLQQKPILSAITLVGVDLVLTREKGGRFHVSGIKGEQISDVRSGGEANDLDTLTAWLFSQGELGLEHSNVTWHDKMANGRKMRFSAVNVSLKNSGDHHILDASVDLPKKFGESLNLHIDMSGDLLDASERTTNAYFHGEGVRFASLLETQSIAGVGANVGEADFQIWSRWKNGALQKMQGEVDIGDVKLFPSSVSGPDGKNKKSDDAVLLLQKLAGKFEWSRKEDGWQFNGKDLMLLREKHLWEPSQIRLNVKNKMDELESIDAYASHLRLEDAAQLLMLFSVGGEKVRAPLQAIKPKGAIADARLMWRNDEQPTYSAYASLDQAAINGWKLIPAAKDVTGELWLNENAGRVDLKTSTMVLNFPGLFRRSLLVDKLGGHIGWQYGHGGWSLQGRDLIANNADVNSRITLDIVKENAEVSPFISLVAKFSDGDGSHVTHYLPTGIMTNLAVDWLDKAIIGGRVATGGTIIHGRLKDFPFDDGSGRFEVRFGVDDGQLNYAKGWPSIHDVDADVQFLGRGLFVNARHGKILSNDIQWATVTMPDMKSKPLRALIKGSVSGKTQDKLDYLVASPQLNASFAKHLEGMSSEGESTLFIDLDLSIGDYKDTLLQGWVDIAENSLSTPALGRILDNANGRLHFYKNGLKADDFSANVFGQAANLKISTDESVSTRNITGVSGNSDVVPTSWINIRADGILHAKELASRYMSPIKDYLKGEAEWNLLFKIPVGHTDGRSGTAVLQAVSQLKGVEIKLPPPFNKKSDDIADMKLQVDFRSGQPPLLHVAYAGVIDSLLEFGEQQGEINVVGIRRGEVRINGGDVSLPDGNGVRVVGLLDEVSLDEWLNLLPIGDSSTIGQKTDPSLLHSTDIAIRKLEAYGQTLHMVRLKSSPEENYWAFDMSSNEMLGRIEIPSDVSIKPIKANLSHFYLSKPRLSGESIDPRDMPALDIQVKDLRYESRRFGELKLETTRVANGLRIEQLVLKPKSTTIISQGNWLIAGDVQDSSVQIQINSSNLGQTLRELGYVDTISKGEGEVRLDLRWPTAFLDIDASRVKGSMNMFLRNGQLIDIDPGAGRLFGMLSLQNLPRRLLLDFSDVFAKGFGFDRIKGSYSIEDSNAYTSNLYLDGPSARIEVAGRTGLVQQDYDQVVTVIPKLGESLPLIGVLTATPQIGAAILFVQKLLQSDINEATKNQYTMTGSWNNPTIEKVKPAKPAVRPNTSLPDNN